MKIVYLGTPEFAVKPLSAVVAAGYDVACVICNPDKPVGRKRILTAPPVKKEAQRLGLQVFQCAKIRNEGVEKIKEIAPDIMITCAFGQILSQEILDIPRLGVINIHASLLPKYRGASPIHAAILNGEKESGVTVMKTEIGIDTGDILLSKKVDIGENETCGELFSRLSDVGASAVVEALKGIESGSIVSEKQNDDEASFSYMIKKQDALIDFSKSATDVKNAVRAYNPSPVAYTFYNGEPIKIYSVDVCDASGKPGEVVENDGKLVVACGVGGISVNVLQKAGGKPMSIGDFLRGNKIEKGYVFAQC